MNWPVCHLMAYSRMAAGPPGPAGQNELLVESVVGGRNSLGPDCRGTKGYRTWYRNALLCRKISNQNVPEAMHRQGQLSMKKFSCNIKCKVVPGDCPTVRQSTIANQDLERPDSFRLGMHDRRIYFGCA